MSLKSTKLEKTPDGEDTQIGPQGRLECPRHLRPVPARAAELAGGLPVLRQSAAQDECP